MIKKEKINLEITNLNKQDNYLLDNKYIMKLN